MADLQGTNVAAPVRPYDSECTYPTALADEIAGGLKYVETESALSTITAERRPVGTVASVGFGKFRQWTGTEWKSILQGADPPKIEYTNSEVQLLFTGTSVSLKAATSNAAGILSASLYSRLMGHGKKHLQDGDDAIASTNPRADTIPQSDKTGKIASGWLAFAAKNQAGLVRLADDGQAPPDEAGTAPFVLRANDSRLAQIAVLKNRLDAFSSPIRYVDQLPAKASALGSTFYCLKNTGALYLLVDALWLPVGNGPRGESGKSAFEIAQLQGYEGSIDQWLEGLKGIDGRDGDHGGHGKSAYELARDGGFSGTLADWLDSLIGKEGKRGNDGKSAYQLAADDGFVGTLSDWLASLDGRDGEQGATGKSAYELATDTGFGGSLSDWLVSLHGRDGERGAAGKNAFELAADAGFSGSLPDWLQSLQGEKGDRGDGQSAYALAVQEGFSGTLADWLASLHGRDGERGAAGKSAFELAADAGFSGSLPDWLQSLQGEKGDRGDGQSAYALAVQEGFSGTLANWLDSLRGRNGEDGRPGKSAYELAADAGFIGSLPDWLQSLQGEKGDRGDGQSAYALAVQEGFSGTPVDWLESLHGKRGDPGPVGKSAYQSALDEGFEGTVSDWLESLIGRQGDPGIKGEKGEDGRGIEIRAYYDSWEDFLADHATGENGDCFGVEGNLYVWAGDRWANVGKLIGASAYEVWLEQPGNYGKSFDDFFDELADRAFSEAEFTTLIQSKVAAWMTNHIASVLVPIVDDWLNRNVESLLAVRLPSQLETSFNTHVSHYHRWQPMS